MNKRIERNYVNYTFTMTMLCALIFILRNNIVLCIVVIINILFYLYITYQKDSDIKYLRYKDSGRIVSMKSGDDFIDLAYQLRFINEPMLVAIKNKKRCRIEPIEMKCVDGPDAYKKIMTDEEYQRIIDWLCKNKELLDVVYINETDYKSCSQDFTELQEYNKNKNCMEDGKIYYTCPAIDDATIENDHFLRVTFRCQLTFILDLESLYDMPLFHGLKDKKVRYNFIVTNYGIIWNDDIDISATYIWTHGKLDESEKIN